MYKLSIAGEHEKLIYQTPERCYRSSGAHVGSLVLGCALSPWCVNKGCGHQFKIDIN